MNKCFIKIEYLNKELLFNSSDLTERNDEIILKFKNSQTFNKIMQAKDILDYGNRLATSVLLENDVSMDVGVEKNPLRSAFFKLLCRGEIRKGMLIFRQTIPCFL